jgi:hypothetical protein
MLLLTRRVVALQGFTLQADWLLQLLLLLLLLLISPAQRQPCPLPT